ncbi:MAG TPA: permease-like cell division protein FtsX [Mobilitalea sp.]|nr:permease-like cell division protein FtsX [Mobilitalea sp.]
MRTFIYNIGYFISEARRTIRFNPLSNLFSVIGTGLILFLFGMVLTGWFIGDRLVTSLAKEAEVSAYFSSDVGEEQAKELVAAIKTMEGVLDAQYIDETQAYEQNKKLLGNEAEILKLFEENPFEAYIDVRINLDDMDAVLSQVGKLQGIDYVRDNREILEQLKGIVDTLKVLGIFIALAVGVTTLIIISHMIRQGIYNNREQINTLWLLGAPNAFIGFPFVLAGTLLTLLGGGLAAALIFIMMTNGYDQLSGYIMFLPLPPMEELRNKVCVIILVISSCLGLMGSIFGLTSIRKSDK